MLDPLAVGRRRLVEQRLAGAPHDAVAEAVRHLGAVQAQEFAETTWSLGERTRDCVPADVEDALDRGDIIRTHVLRPTWHRVASADLRWMLRLTRPRVHALNRYMYRRLELDADTLSRAHQVIAGTLADGRPRTRSELAGRLAAAGIEGRRAEAGVRADARRARRSSAAAHAAAVSTPTGPRGSRSPT